MLTLRWWSAAVEDAFAVWLQVLFDSMETV